MSNQEIQQQLTKDRKTIHLSECLLRLENNKDFVELIKMYYSSEYVVGLVQKLAYYDKQSPEYITTMNELNTVSSFNKFLDIIKTNGAMAKDSLEELIAIPQDEMTYE